MTKKQTIAKIKGEKIIKEMPEIDYEKVYQYDSYTYLLLHKAFEEEGMKLKKGNKVIPTKWAIQNGICKEKDKGIVVGFGRNLSSIKIKKNNLKTISSYWLGFWRLNDKKQKKNYENHRRRIQSNH